MDGLGDWIRVGFEDCSSKVVRFEGFFKCSVADCKDRVGIGRIRYQGLLSGSGWCIAVLLSFVSAD